MPETHHVTSQDGTRIGYESLGGGPPLLVVHGTAADRSQWAAIQEHLAERFSTYVMDRRGRGLSAEETDGAYALEREGEDVAAVAAAIGEPSFVFAHSYGGLCVLKAALLGAGFERMLIDESPTGRPGPPMLPEEIADGLEAALEAGGPDGALEFFLRTVVGLNDEQIDGVRGSDMWKARTATIHTALREARAANAYQREGEELARLAMPIRFVVGSDSTEPMRGAAEAAHADMPQSELHVVEGRLFTSMYGDPAATAREIGDWFLV